MECLPPPPCFSVPTTAPPSLFTERINVSQPRPFKLASIPLLARSTPASPSNGSHPARFDSTVSSTKLSPPLPTIPASPICSTVPTSIEISQPLVDIASSQGDRSIPAHVVNQDGDAVPPGSNMSLHMLLSTPIWISTPPTPPHKPVNKHPSRDSQTGFTPVLTSASFPSIVPPRAEPTHPQCGLKRCLSSPATSLCLRTTSDPALNFDISRLSGGSGSSGQRPGSPFNPSNQLSGSEYASSPRDHTPAGSSDTHFSDTDIPTEDLKDVVRILHALRELLVTELDYVKDLRVLSVYIQHLSKFEVRASAFARASATFTSGPWVNAYAGQTLTQVDLIVPSAPSPLTKPVFTEAEIDILSRNIKDILLVHEEFLSTLQELLLPLGCSNTTGPHQYESEDVWILINVLKNVSRTFIAEASKFDAYQAFCAGHPEALNLIRRAMSQHTSEWESFEQRCCIIISRSHNTENSPISPSSPHQFDSTDETSEQKRRRTISLTSAGNKSTFRSAKEGYRALDKSQLRLAFVDYLIKPVQRICKYPLLLERLKPKSLLVGSDDVVFTIENAVQIMRSVATSVDEAHHRREAVAKSSLIISRLILPPASPLPSPTSGVAAQQSPVHTLTSPFLSSLGPCLLAGSLDVLSYSPYNSIEDFSSLTAKYLGVFLYSGGYIILAKIHKGKKYEPRHWFSLADFEIRGGDREEAMLPCSFRLTSKSIHFELAAACQREKDIWVQNVRDSVKQQRAWVNTPLPSYSVIRSPHRSIDATDEFKAMASAGSDGESSVIVARRDSRRRRLTLKKSDAVALQDHFRLPNRRSSTTSIKSIFATVNYDSNSIYINRSMISGRLQVDHGLQDVASPVCLSARLYASLHDEELFPQPPQESREWSGFSRSNSAISVAGLARNRISKQESLRIPRRKAPSYDNVVIFQSRAEENRPHGKAFHFPTLPDLIDSHSAERTRPFSASSTCFSNTPCSSSSTVIDGSDSCSRPSSPLSLGRKSSRFSLRNVKDFLHINGSQSAALSPDRLHPENLDTGHPPPFTSRWKRGTARRRSRSAPPDEDLIST